MHMDFTDEDIRQFQILCLKSHTVNVSPDKTGETIARLTPLYGSIDEWVWKQDRNQPLHIQ